MTFSTGCEARTLMRDPFPWSNRVLRRDMLRVGALTAFGVGLGDAFRARALGAEPPGAETPQLVGPASLRQRSCILIWLDGGPSHLDTFDPKPDAPREVRGPFGTLPTATPGVHFSELLPKCAKLADRLAVIRSMTSPLGEHNFGSHYLLTGYRPSPALVYPSCGSIVAHASDPRATLPAYIGVGKPNQPDGGPGIPAGERGAIRAGR